MQSFHYIFIYLPLFVSFASVPTSPIGQFLTPVDHTIKLTVTLTKIVFELSFVYLLIFPYVNPKTFFFIESVITLICLIVIFPNPIPMSDSLLEVTFIDRRVRPEILPVSICHTIHIFTYID